MSRAVLESLLRLAKKEIRKIDYDLVTAGGGFKERELRDDRLFWEHAISELEADLAVWPRIRPISEADLERRE